MAVTWKQAPFAVMLMFLTLVLTVSCKPETPPNRAPQTGVLAAPVNTPLSVIAIRPTSVSPLPTPLPRVITPPAPQPTPALLIGPQTLYDPISHFSLTLPPGWYASVPDSHFASVTDITNYNFSTESRPLNGISIQIQAGPLPPSQSFEQWLADFRVRETSPDSGAFGVTLTVPQPYKLGHYEGIAYVATGQEGESVLVLLIQSGDGWVAVISLIPYDATNPSSPEFSEAISMLSTIQISSEPLR